MKYIFFFLLFLILNIISAGVPKPCLCTPTTTSYNACCPFGISNVTFNTINKTTQGGVDGYQDYSSAINTNVLAGKRYTISINVGGFGPSKQNVKAWIDYNNDGKLDSLTEEVYKANSVLIASGNIFIPATAIRNTALRMRIAADYDLSGELGPCKNQQYGQAEDYSITILDNTNPPDVTFHAANTTSCSGEVDFFDDSQNIPSSWLWDFGDGQTSSQKDPDHTYSVSGTYKVKLKATNAYGSDIDSIINYITVTLGAAPITASCSPNTLAYCCQYGIANVIFKDINHSSADASEGYKDFSCTKKTNLIKGQSYPITITTSGAVSHDVRVWIDYNNDGTFNTTTELAFTKNNQKDPTGTIVIPSSTSIILNTPLRMRVFADYPGCVATPCTTPTYGQIEDYTVVITNTIGIDETELKNSFNVFPNPSDGNMTIQFNLSAPEKISVSLYDMMGREVFCKTSESIIQYSESINLSHLKKGIYCIKVMTESEQIVKTILIE